MTRLFILVAVFACLFAVLGTPTYTEELDTHVYPDKLVVVGAYCIEGHVVVHYNVQRYQKGPDAYLYKKAAHGLAQEFNTRTEEGCE